MDTARLWVLRVAEPDFSGWDMLTEWLESDSGHNEAYEAAIAEDEWVRDLGEAARFAGPTSVIGHGSTPALPSSSIPKPRRQGEWRRIMTGAMAASLVGVVLWFGAFRGPDLTEVATGPGEQREIALADGSMVTVNGNSRISYDADTPRHIILDSGEVLFEVEHDEANPFIVMAGNTRLVDAGTVFNVTRDGGSLDVAVAEGAVMYQAGSADITLRPGDRLTRAAEGAATQVLRADPDVIGGWRDGVLQYDNAPLPTIARDLSRALGKPVRVASGATQMRYSGTLSTTGTDREMLGAAGALLGVTITETASSWEMAPAHASSP